MNVVGIIFTTAAIIACSNGQYNYNLNARPNSNSYYSNSYTRPVSHNSVNYQRSDPYNTNNYQRSNPYNSNTYQRSNPYSSNRYLRIGDLRNTMRGLVQSLTKRYSGYPMLQYQSLPDHTSMVFGSRNFRNSHGNYNNGGNYGGSRGYYSASNRVMPSRYYNPRSLSSY